MAFRTLDDLNVTCKVVLVRSDLNVSVKDGMTDAPLQLFRIRSALLLNVIGMLRMIGYPTKITRFVGASEALTEGDIELGRISEPAAQILLAWLRTIPGVEVSPLHYR